MAFNIDVGCGGRGTRYQGFIGIDKWPVDGVHEDRGKATYVQRDVVNQGLAFESNSVDLAVCLHVLEHLLRPDGLKMLGAILRVLKPGSVAYVSTPDLRLMAERYLAQDQEFYDKRYEPSGKRIWNGPELADKFLDSIIGMGPYGHRYGYDLDSLVTVCREAGFEVSTEVADDCPYHTRRDHEVIVEVRKPE